MRGKLGLLLGLGALVGVLAVTGLGATFLKAADKRLGLRSVEARIRENLRELNDKRLEARKSAFRLKSKAGTEAEAMKRTEAERKRVDDACFRLARRINETKKAGAAQVEWGPHTMSVEEGMTLLTQWGKAVEGYDAQIAGSKSKIEAFEKASALLDKEIAGFARTISALEARQQELLAGQEVLKVQQEVAELMSSLSGRDVPGETAELMTELQTLNDERRGMIAAYGATMVGDSIISPEDDLTTNTADDMLSRYTKDEQAQ
jgi:chromosome segregation ATPase